MIFDVIKRYLVVRSFDFMDYLLSRVQYGIKGIDVDEVIKWWKSGGIVVFCWYWNVLIGFIDQLGKEWWRGFYIEVIIFDFKKVMDNLNFEEYKFILRDIDVIVEQFKKLQVEGVLVFFRLFYEVFGGWFWWGVKGLELYIKFWKFMFDRFVNYYKINNLIWVWNGQDVVWYLGDQYVDIIVEDIYEEKVQYLLYIERFVKVFKYINVNKMIVFFECGIIFDLVVLK